MRIGSDCSFIYIWSKHLHLHKGVPGGTDFHICNSWLQRELGHNVETKFSFSETFSESFQKLIWKIHSVGQTKKKEWTAYVVLLSSQFPPPANTIIFLLHNMDHIYITSVQQRGDVYMDAEHEGKIGPVCACKGRLQKRLLIFTCLSKMLERGWLINNARKL